MEEEKREYKNKVAYKQTDEYIEEKARNDLNLIKPGEKVYVVSKEFKEIDLESKVLGQKYISGKLFFGKFDHENNVVKWIKLFTR